MEANPYEAPAAIVAEPSGSDDLADRGSRLGAAFTDGIIGALLVVPLFFGTGILGKVQSGQISAAAYLLGSAVVGFLLFALVQSYPLAKWGQTWGKRALGIRIAHLDGKQPTLSTLLVKRYLPIQATQAVPLVGNVLVLVDMLFIFRADRRCLHDLIAGTRVIKN